jgi:DNA-directed RNA polymerase subunit RPC12/RpoP
MECPKCGKNTVIKITTKNKTKVKEKKGLVHLVIYIITFPFWGLWRILFGKKRQNFAKKMVWNCRYCDHMFDDKRVD